MALLTAEDVLNKAFSKTKYREGFDQDEVDDFLDEVANSIAALTAERDELQQRLAQAQAGGAVVPPAAPVVAVAGEESRSETLLQAATDPNPPSATTMLAMAQKLHDEYVQAGEEARDRLIDEGKVKAESIVEQAEKDARGRMQDLDTERADVERRIDDLRRFERDYRGHLRNYLENLLGDLEHNTAKGAPGPVGAPVMAEEVAEQSALDDVATEFALAESPERTSFIAAATDVADEAAPALSFPESASAFTTPESPLPQEGAFVPSEEILGEQAPVNPFGDPNEVPASSEDDSSGDDSEEAPRWNF